MQRVWALALALAAVAAAQHPGEIQLQAKLYLPGFHFTASSRLVEVPVVVTDSSGRAVAGFGAADFTVLDDGRAQAITYFSVEEQAAERGAAGVGTPAKSAAVSAAQGSPRPRSVGLLFDDLDTPAANLDWCRKAALEYVAQDAAPGDRWAVMTTSEQVAQAFTSDRVAVERAIGKIAASNHPIAEDDPDTPPQLRMPPEMIALFAAHTLSGIADAVRYTALQPGERELLLASKGFKSKAVERQVAQLTAAAVRSQVVVNTLDALGLDIAEKIGSHLRANNLAERAPYTSVLFTLAHDTGGSMVENTNLTTASYQRLASGPGVRYRLGFVPQGSGVDGAYHKLSVRLARPHVAVQARVGYYEAPARDAVAAALETKLDRAMAGASYAELPIALATEPLAKSRAAAGSGGRGVNAVVRLMPAALPYGADHGRSREQLRYYAVLRDAAGRYISGQEGDMALSLSAPTRTRLDTAGLYAALALAAPAGRYQILIVVQELAEGRTATLRHAVLVQ